MRALVFRRYGDPEEVMELVDGRDLPRPAPHQVLVRLEHCSVNAADRHMVHANYLIVRLLLGLTRPSKKNRILGMDVAGSVHALGQDVQGLALGDAVVADVRKALGGGFAEYAVVNASDLVRKPAKVSFADAATVPISGQAAMMGIKLCEVKPGDRVLVNGASGGVGSFAVQIAKARGAHVTALCSASKSERVKSWGADRVVDYTRKVDALAASGFDSIFDAACFAGPSELAPYLKSDGIYVLVGGTYYNMLRVKMFGRMYARGAQRFLSMKQKVAVTKNIEEVLELIADGDVTPAIQRQVPLKDVPSAIRSLGKRTVVGKIVVNNQL